MDADNGSETWPRIYSASSWSIKEAKRKDIVRPSTEKELRLRPLLLASHDGTMLRFDAPLTDEEASRRIKSARSVQEWLEIIQHLPSDDGAGRDGEFVDTSRLCAGVPLRSTRHISTAARSPIALNPMESTRMLRIRLDSDP
jgi:hypothetical protein